MKLADMKPGTKLELEINDDFYQKMKAPLISEFEWEENGKRALIAVPISEGILYPLRVGTAMNVYFQSNQELYRFSATVVKRGLKDGIDLLLVEVRSDFEKIQRREFFRFEWSLPIKYRIIPPGSTPEKEEGPFKESITRDISGGGLSVALEELIERGETLECQLLFKNKKAVHFTGKVVRSSKYELEGKYKYEIGVVFERIQPVDQEKVIKYIFEEQRKLRKKGLI